MSLQHIGPSETQALVQAYFTHLVAVTELSDLSAPEASEAYDWGAYASEEAAVMLRRALEACELDEETITHFAEFIAAKGVAFESLGATRKLAVRGAMAARIEHARYFQARVENPGSHYVPANQVFATKLASDQDTHPSKGVSLKKAVDAYFSERSKTWRPRSYLDYQRVLGWLLEHFGEEKPLSSIAKVDAAAFRTALLKLEKRSTKASFKERQIDAPESQIAHRTASKYLGLVTAFFAWAANDAGHIESSPFVNVSIAFKKAKSGAAKAATPEALKAFLLSPLFQGHYGDKLHKKGTKVYRGEHYWLGLLQLFLGARAGEIAQLRVSDVTTIKGHAAVLFRATDDLGADVAGKALKTKSASRDVPLPKALLELAFMDYVESKCALDQDAALFPSFSATKGGNWSARATKFSSRYLERIGQKQVGKANHWLRHAWTDAMKDGEVEDSIIAQLEGHAEAGMKAVYGKGNNWPAKVAAINKANFGFDPLDVLLSSKARWVSIKK